MVTTDPKALLGKQVRKLRKELGYTQEELAHRAHLHRNYVGGIERGERNVSLENIVELAYALDVRPRILLDTIPARRRTERD